jgi:hypothetical protein
VSAGIVQARAFVYQLEQLAADVGRLRRRLRDDEYGLHLVDRIGGRVDAIDSLVHPCAAELVVAGDTVDEALAFTDGRAFRIRALLGVTPR